MRESPAECVRVGNYDFISFSVIIEKLSILTNTEFSVLPSHVDSDVLGITFIIECNWKMLSSSILFQICIVRVGNYTIPQNITKITRLLIIFLKLITNHLGKNVY